MEMETGIVNEESQISSLHTQGFYHVKNGRICAKHSETAYCEAPAVLFDRENGQVHSIDTPENLRLKMPYLIDTIAKLPYKYDAVANLCRMEYDYDYDYLMVISTKSIDNHISVDDYCTLLNFITHNAYDYLDTLKGLITTKTNMRHYIGLLKKQGY